MKALHRIENGVELKQCVKCKAWFPVDGFRKDRSKWDGLYSYCKGCSKTKDHNVYMKNPEQKRQKVIEYQRRTGLINRYKPYNPDYYSSEKSREKKHVRDMKRRLLVKRANTKFKITDDVRMAVYERYNGKCAYCGAEYNDEFHIDHKTPLFRGGENDINNLALSCPTCNQKKGKKTDVEYTGRCV